MDGRWDSETLDDALDVLGDLPEWRLPSPRWEQVSSIVDRMRQAFDAGDVVELRDATADLELHGPVRANRMGTKDPAPANASIKERQNTLVHDLNTASADLRRRAGTDQEADGADQPPR
ncbi:CATRA system-associated protein [Actinoplanes sp. HUAS TT8]|uniref:CATRA system-associated protein n=1 Tax=Actinoplanes sp. HUAS TT8 TaxID=3447453 RepID=UPI003F51B723